MSQLTANRAPEHVRVAVLGAGLSGICMGIQLKQHGIENFVILEKANAVGGTWRENTYPGIACDVPSHVYSYSFELNPEWSHSYGSGQEIWDYCNHCVDKYGLSDQLRFGAEVTSARFDGDQWQIETDQHQAYSADVVVSGLGGLHLPKHTDFPGASSFSGRMFHTAQWDHSHNLAGRRVAIIGTGASAAQVLPAIAPEVAEVTVFQRSAAWVLPRMAREIPPERRALFRRHPLLMRLFRWSVWLLLDTVGVLSLRRGGPLSARLRKICLGHLRRSVHDPELRAKLTPDYEPGCKRRCVSDDYLETFNRNNVRLCTDAISAIEADGIRDATGKLHQVDTIIEATGFKPFDIAEYIDIRGRDGYRLLDAWQDRVSAYRSVMVPRFPNLFLLLGPNSGTGHTSALIMIESQVQFVLRCLQFLETREVQQLDPDPAATERYNARLQRDMRKMVFSGGCGGWYTDDADRNFTLWPYSASRFVAELKQFRARDFSR
jgi:cation diffusion facilitator CzcD-associated flavoprotein CzcO